jgi:N-acetylmuramoyl-L-alanine amidase
MPVHVVQQGECITSIADQYGFLWQGIWGHSENSSLRQKRKDPNVLYPGDSVFIPDPQVKEESRSTDQTHNFEKRGAPAKINLRLLVEDKPRAGENYRLVIDGITKNGKIDDDGHVKESVPPAARSAMLYVGNGTTQDVYQLQLGTLDPIDTSTGLTARLFNLGYGTDDIAEAIRAFQAKKRLPVTGQADDATRSRLVSEFGQ